MEDNELLKKEISGMIEALEESINLLNSNCDSSLKRKKISTAFSILEGNFQRIIRQIWMLNIK